MLQRTGEAETITTHYLFALGIYRALYIPNWFYRYFSEGRFDPISVFAGILQTVLYSDFFYIYWTKYMSRSFSHADANVTKGVAGQEIQFTRVKWCGCTVAWVDISGQAGRPEKRSSHGIVAQQPGPKGPKPPRGLSYAATPASPRSCMGRWLGVTSKTACSCLESMYQLSLHSSHSHDVCLNKTPLFPTLP